MDTSQRYFPLGEEMWQSMLIDLKNAKNFIYIEYFIIEEGVFWNSILKKVLSPFIYVFSHLLISWVFILFFGLSSTTPVYCIAQIAPALGLRAL